MSAKAPIPVWLLVIGATAIAAGLATCEHAAGFTNKGSVCWLVEKQTCFALLISTVVLPEELDTGSDHSFNRATF